MIKNFRTKSSKRILAFCMALLMILSLIPVNTSTVFAYESEGLEETNGDLITDTDTSEEITMNEDSEGNETVETTNPKKTLSGGETVKQNQEDGVAVVSDLDSSKKEDTNTSAVFALKQGEVFITTADGKNTAELSLTYTPEEGAETAVTWSSSDEKIATVDANGKITAVANGMAVITVKAGETLEDTCNVYVGYPVFFTSAQDLKVKVSDYVTSFEVYSYVKIDEEESTENPVVLAEETNEENEPKQDTSEGAIKSSYVILLDAGAYTYTATGDGYYGSTCAFTVKEDGTVAYTSNWTSTVKTSYGLDKMLDTVTGTFHLELETFTPSSNQGAWDGTTLDVSWFDPAKTEHHIKTPAQLAGLAAIVNGIYNEEITTIIDSTGTYTADEYKKLSSAKIVEGCSSIGEATGPNGGNQVSSSDYYYSRLGYDFDGMTVYLDADLDMGGYQDENGNWTGARYMPIGGQYTMYYVKTELSDGFSHLGSSFNGTLDGQGHTVYNIYCNRYSATNFGDSSSIGLVGRLGIHDSDYTAWQSTNGKEGNYPAVNPSVRNVAVDGFIYGRRSVGGVVGKVGQTSASTLSDGTIGGIIENCVNFATVKGTDKKGCAGICGASWNKGVIRNCVNFGTISQTMSSPAGGITGYNEFPIVNCYNTGSISAASNSYAMAIGTNNGGSGNDIRNCYWLTGTASGGGYYGIVNDKTQIVEVTDGYSEGVQAIEYLKSDSFLKAIRGTGRGWTFAKETDFIYTRANGFPVPVIFTDDDATITSIEKKEDVTKLTYAEGEKFDTTGLKVYAKWSDGVEELIEDFTLSIDRELLLTDKEITVSKTVAGKTWSHTYQIEVVEKQLDSIKVSTQPTRRVYNEEDTFDPTGMKVALTFTNKKTAYAIYTDGKFVDMTDAAVEYNISLNPSIEEKLGYEKWNGQKVTVTCTYKNETRTAETSALTVVSKENRPEQDENGVYLVSSADELNWVSNQVKVGVQLDISVKLTNDITLNDEYKPIGSTTLTKYAGTFDGDGHKITLNYTPKSGTYYGVFGYVNGATIRNLIVDGEVSVANYAAGVVAHATNAKIENCINKANITITASTGYSAGIAAAAITSEIVNCGNEGNLTGGRCAGIAGNLQGGIVKSCYNNGDLSTVSAVGGITAYASAKPYELTDCYNWGTISGSGNSALYAVGGIAGYDATNSTISNVYNLGTITYTTKESKFVGAIVGRKYGTVSNYYWLNSCAATYANGGTTPDTEGLCTTAVDLISGVLAIKDTTFKANDGCFPVLNWQTVCGHDMKEDVCIRCGAEKTNGDGGDTNPSDPIWGDINGDSEIDIKDSMLLRRYLAGWDVEINLFECDLNEDGNVDVKDSMLLRRYLAGWNINN